MQFKTFWDSCLPQHGGYMARDCRPLKTEDCLIQGTVRDLGAQGKILAEIVMSGTGQKFDGTSIQGMDLNLYCAKIK